MCEENASLPVNPLQDLAKLSYLSILSASIKLNCPWCPQLCQTHSSWGYLGVHGINICSQSMFLPWLLSLILLRGSYISGGEAYLITSSFFLYGEQTQHTVWWSFLKLVQWECWILSLLKSKNWCYCLLFISEWKHKDLWTCHKSVFLHKDQGA